MIQDNLVSYITSMGIKQSVIAEQCGMTDMAISSSMRGERKLTLDEFSSICQFLGMSMDAFQDAAIGAS